MLKNKDIKKESDDARMDEVVKNDVNAIMQMSRRTFVKVAGAAVGALAFGRLDIIPRADAVPATVNLNKFVDPLISAIPKLVPTANPLYPGAEYYEIYMGQGNWQFSNQLPIPPANSTWGYGSSYNQPLGANVFLGHLGPSIEATKGTRVVVKFINNLPAAHPFQTSIDPTVPDPMMYKSPDGTPLPASRAVPHLHGGFTQPQFDGLPHSWFTSDTAISDHGSQYGSLPGAAPNEAIFEYGNNQLASNLWYHDHAMGITRLNVYAGLAGLYFIRDNPATGGDTGLPGNSLGLPAGPYEIPLVIQDKQFKPDGSLFYPTVGLTATHPIWVPEFFGDTAVVNGKAFPFLNVEPRRYRFRILNGSQARFYNMWIAGAGKGNLPMWVIGMEQSLLSGTAVPLQKLLLAPGERADVIVDFTGIKPGTSFVLSNDANVPYPGGGKRGGPKIPDIMQFNVVPLPVGATDPTTPPASLVLPTITPLVATPGAPTREIILKETLDPVTLMPIHIRLNELWYNDPVVGIEEAPKVGDTEIWQFVNLTIDAHPMHMHLVQFQVVNRQAFNALTYTTAYLAWVNDPITPRNPATKPLLANYLIGAVLPPAPEESGWKDTVKAYPGQVTRVIAKFDVPAGTILPAEYVYHCHILEHEENEMMRPMKVVP